MKGPRIPADSQEAVGREVTVFLLRLYGLVPTSDRYGRRKAVSLPRPALTR